LAKDYIILSLDQRFIRHNASGCFLHNQQKKKSGLEFATGQIYSVTKK
jgi:hypothetical protein